VVDEVCWDRFFFSEYVFLLPVSFHHCFMFSFISRLLLNQDKLFKPGNLQKAVLFSEIRVHWAETHLHVFLFFKD